MGAFQEMLAIVVKRRAAFGACVRVVRYDAQECPEAEHCQELWVADPVGSAVFKARTEIGHGLFARAAPKLLHDQEVGPV